MTEHYRRRRQIHGSAPIASSKAVVGSGAALAESFPVFEVPLSTTIALYIISEAAFPEVIEPPTVLARMAAEVSVAFFEFAGEGN